MIRRLILGVTAAVMVAGVAHAAVIQLEGKNADGIAVVSVSGDFVVGDIERFADVMKDLDDAIISFISYGGDLSAGIEIGTRIRLRGYRTVVADRQECYSACALAWLGGTTRYVGRGTRIGFHAAYRERDGRFQETGVGNAVVGGYAANLGLRTPAIIFLTSAPPEGLNYLTESLSQQVGISAEFTETSGLISIPPRLSEKELIGPDHIEADPWEEFTEIPREKLFRPDDTEAVRWLRLAAEQGNANAQFNLGLMYDKGEGVGQDHAEAARWYRLSAEQGVAYAQLNLGFMYNTAEGVGQDHAEAARWFRLSAEQGDANAQYNLGLMYDKGEGVGQDHAEAARWYRLSAEQGVADAQANLGRLYDKGEGVGQDHAEAARWFRLSAEQGVAFAQFNLGLQYTTGKGVQEDHAEAARWYRLAAEQGDALAQSLLGLLYAYGQGVPQDAVIAYMWYNLAAAQGDETAKQNRALITRHMNAYQIAEAQRMAREWQPKK